jgi:hypothetical protein
VWGTEPVCPVVGLAEMATLGGVLRQLSEAPSVGGAGPPGWKMVGRSQSLRTLSSYFDGVVRQPEEDN